MPRKKKSMSMIAQENRRNLLKLAGFASIGMVAMSPTTAAAAIDISHKIRIAGDLRTFTQEMALASAFVMLDVEKDHYLDVLREEFDEFSSDIEVLRAGKAEYSMEPEANVLVLEAINTVELGWSILGPAIKDVIDTGEVDDAHFTKIEKVNVQVMTLADSLIHRIMNEYKEDIPTELAYQIDVVGMQRTLSQKMVKEALLVGLEFEAEAHHEMLIGSIQVFQFGMDKLRGEMLHNEVFLPDPGSEIAERLDAVDEIWKLLEPNLVALDTTHDVQGVDVVELAHEAEDMMNIFNEIYAMLIQQAEIA